MDKHLYGSAQSTDIDRGDLDARDEIQPITLRTIPIELRFHGDGRLVRRGGVISGGVVDPEIAEELGFEMWREAPDEHGQLNPVLGEPTVNGAFQLSVAGTAAGFRELARYLLAFAELDVLADPRHHDHHELVSADGRTRLHVILRRADEGDAS